MNNFHIKVDIIIKRDVFYLYTNYNLISIALK